jgi:serine phosphatase RsbU (regulator of sigma subunit)/anti-sigma regulatory factor (Ser/Thr protein kinase)/anti-anti-sigma regulatory factor
VAVTTVDDALRQKAGDPKTVLGAFDQMPVMLMAMRGAEHRVAGLNAACRRFLGRSGVLGMPLRQILPEIAGEQVFELLDRVLATGQQQAGRELRIRVRRGSGPVVATHIDFTAVPWLAGDGTVSGVLISFTESAEHVPQQREAQAQRHSPGARDVVTELQGALLPMTLPVLPWARIAARYLVAAQDQGAGGDWFDAIPVPGDRVALIVGDVVGHGVAASAAMGQLRAVLNERLLAEPDLAAALAQADAFATRTPALRAATLVLAVLDPRTGHVSYATCGHPPPLVTGSGGTTRFLPGTGTGPLGTGSAPVLAEAVLEPGELILLYSDGLIERPDRTLTEGMDELAAVAADAAANRAMPVAAAGSAAERVCQLTVELLTRTGYADDVTTLAAQRLVAPVQALTRELPARNASVRAIQDSIEAWLARIDLFSKDWGELRLAIIEVVTNIIEHAYPPGQPGPIDFHAQLGDDGFLTCRIADRGVWRGPGQGHARGGSGLMLAGHLVDHLEVRRGPATETGEPAGTVVWLRHRLHRPAAHASRASAQAAAHPSAEPFAVGITADAGRANATVRGPVDITTADRLASRLMAACRGGTLPLTVDLSQVSHLASAGVRALYQVRDRLATQHQALTLHASEQSPARTVLDLVKLPASSGGGASRAMLSKPAPG